MFDLSKVKWLAARGLIIAGLLFIAIWPSIYNGQPYFFTDTTAYIRGADAAIGKALGKSSIWTQDAAAPSAPEISDAQKTTDPNKFRSLSSAEDKSVLAGRSIFYGALLYAAHAIGALWPALIFQGGIFLLAVAQTLVNLRSFSWTRFGITSIALCVVTPAAFFNSYLMPDLFAGILILSTANLLAFGRKMLRWQLLFWFLVLCCAMLFHTSHLLIAIVILAGAALWEIWRRRSISRMGAIIIALALVVGFTGETVFSIGVKKMTGAPPIRPPFLMARLIADGVGYEYLKATCPGSGFVLCNYLDRLPTASSDYFLWSFDPTIGVFAPESTEVKRALAAEQLRFVIGAITYDPLEFIREALTNTFHQLSFFGLDEFAYSQEDLTRYAVKIPEPYRTRLLSTVAAHGNAFAQGYTFLIYGAVILSLGFLGYGIARRRWPLRSGPIVLFSSVIALGIFANAAICGVLGMPHARYEARVIWLLPALIGMLECRRQAARRMQPNDSTSADNRMI